MTDTEFSNLIRDAKDAITPDGEIPYLRRQGLRGALRELLGHRRGWVWLELICARKVWHIWQMRFPAEPEPIKLVVEAEAHLTSGAEVVTFGTLASMKTCLDDKFLLGEEAFPAVYAGFACWAAARSSLVDPPARTDVGSEREFEPEGWDASFMASLAYSGGAVWEQGVGDNARRREFWEWFLCDAVPEACRRAAGA